MKKYENPNLTILELTANDVLNNGSGPDIVGGALSNDEDTPAMDVWPF